MPRRLVSIASAPGWKARFGADAPYEDERVVTLVAWALVEDGGETEIVGYVQRTSPADGVPGPLEPADEVEGFLGYTFTGLAVRGADT